MAVDVPRGAVPAGETIEVRVGDEIGKFSGPFATELAGKPVQVEHRKPLAGALTVSWELPALSALQRSTLVLARWDPAAKAWRPSPIKPTWKGSTLTAAIKEFSFWTWIANAGQQVGQVVGARVDEPHCDGRPLPSWVTSTVDPDQDLAAAAIRVCYEPDKDNRVTVRIANNRTFSQQLDMTYGGQRWAWVWRGKEVFDPKAIVYLVAHNVFDSGTRFLMPPLSTQAVGIARPASPGSHHIAARATVSGITMAADVTAYVLDQLDIGGADNPVLNAMMQALYECGGKQLLGRPDAKDPAAILRAVVGAIGGCADELMRPDSEFGLRFEYLSRTLIAKAGLSQSTAIKANRVAREITAKLRILAIGEVAFYLSDQLANSLVGPLYWSINGRRTPQQLGQWTPSCTSLEIDSNRLFRNLTLQDQFADTRKELWQFPGFKAAAENAVGPLEDCSTDHRGRLANHLPKDWADSKAAGIVAAAILDSLPGVSTKSLLNAQAPAMCTHPSGRLINGVLPLQKPSQQGYVSIRLSGVEYVQPLKPATADLTGDGAPETVVSFSCSAGGVTWPETIAVYGLGTVLVGSVYLGDHTEGEHSDVTALKTSGNKITIHWTTYDGCCFNPRKWTASIKLRNSQLTVADVKPE